MTTEQNRAVKTAGERLEQIEVWSRRTFIAAIVAAVCLAILTSIAGYITYDYVTMKNAVRAAANDLDRGLSDLGRQMKSEARQPF